MSVYRALGISAVALGVAVSSLVLAQGTAKPKKDPRGPLPANYGKLGLTDEQRDKMYPIYEEYDKKIDDLAAQIKKLQTERNDKLNEMLTPAQKARLKEIDLEEATKKAEQSKKNADAAPKPESN
jgi:Spy/CpxP family protein refolding chaperone